MKIEFVPTARDHINVIKYLNVRLKTDLEKRRSTFSSILIGLIFAFLFVVPAMLFVVNHPSGTNLFIGYLVIILILFIFAAAKYQKWQILNLIEAALTKNPETIILTDRGLETESNKSMSTFSWAEIRDIAENNNYILFNLPLYKCIFIPKSAFENSEQSRTFIETAHNYMNTFNK